MNVLVNDEIPAFDDFFNAATVVDFTQPSVGELFLGQNGVFNYTPPEGFSGTVTFTYTIEDYQPKQSSALVTIIVPPGPDAFEANPDFIDYPDPIFVLANDTYTMHPDIVDFTLPVQGGSLTLQGEEFIYTPPEGFSGIDSFTYEISDGEQISSAVAQITVEAENRPPEALDDFVPLDIAAPAPFFVWDNDSDPDGDDISIVGHSDPIFGAVQLNGDGSFSYFPDPTDAQFMPYDRFTYTIEDEGGLEATAEVQIELEGTLPDFAKGESEDALDDYLTSTDPNASLSLKTPEIYLDDDASASDGGWGYTPGQETLPGATPQNPSNGAGGIDEAFESLENGLTDLLFRAVDGYLERSGLGRITNAIETLGDALDIRDMAERAADGLKDMLLDGQDRSDDIFERYEQDLQDKVNEKGLPFKGIVDALGFSSSQSAISLAVHVGPVTQFAEHRDTYFGSPAANTVFLGANDDTAFGGGGDDILHGEAGDDLLNGGEGNDTLSGGPGDDTLIGGPGSDVASYPLASGNYQVTGDAAEAVVTGPDGTDILRGVETLIFPNLTLNLVGGTGPRPLTLAEAQEVAYIYEAGLGRRADGPGLNFWIDAREDVGLTPLDLTAYFLQSPEFTNNVGPVDLFSDRALVEALYLNVLGRPGELQGVNFWTSVLGLPGYTREQLLLDFANSPENKANRPHIDAMTKNGDGLWVLPIVAPLNQPPVAVPDQAFTAANQIVQIDALANDFDPDGDPISLVGAAQIGPGTVSTLGDLIVFDPIGQFDNLLPGQSRTENISYSISDGIDTTFGNVAITVNGAAIPLEDAIPADQSTTAFTDRGILFTDAIDFDGDADWIEVQLDADNFYTFTLRPSGFDPLGFPVLDLFDASGNPVAFADPIFGEARLDFAPDISGTYYVQASGDAGGGEYTLGMVYSEDEGFPDFIGPGGSVNGAIDFNGDIDWFFAFLSAGESYRIDLLGADSGGGSLADPVLGVRNIYGEEIAFNDDSFGTLDSTIFFTPPETGEYFLTAESFGFAEFDGYTLLLS